MESNSIAGEYYLQGAREMASGFLIKPEGMFQFFFTYGALDRYGSGRWELKGDQLILNSTARPSHDFALIESKSVPGDQVTVRIKDKNRNLLSYVFASLKNGIKDSWTPASHKGEIVFPKQEITTISLLFEFCQERFSTFEVENKTHNDFTFRFEPWLAEVFLHDFILQVGNNVLIGGHPLMEGIAFRYAKQ